MIVVGMECYPHFLSSSWALGLLVIIGINSEFSLSSYVHKAFDSKESLKTQGLANNNLKIHYKIISLISNTTNTMLSKCMRKSYCAEEERKKTMKILKRKINIIAIRNLNIVDWRWDEDYVGEEKQNIKKRNEKELMMTENPKILFINLFLVHFFLLLSTILIYLCICYHTVYEICIKIHVTEFK